VHGLRNTCLAIYDIANQHLYTQDEIARISPFILVDETSQLFASDETAILTELGSARTQPRGLPTKETLNQAVTHPNPAVRQSAARMLKAMGS